MRKKEEPDVRVRELTRVWARLTILAKKPGRDPKVPNARLWTGDYSCFVRRFMKLVMFGIFGKMLTRWGPLHGDRSKRGRFLRWLEETWRCGWFDALKMVFVTEQCDWNDVGERLMLSNDGLMNEWRCLGKKRKLRRARIYVSVGDFVTAGTNDSCREGVTWLPFQCIIS